MNCERYSEGLSDAVDGTLEPSRQAELDAHLRACAECRELLSDLMEIRAAAATLDRLTPSPDMWEAIAAKIDLSRPATAASPLGGSRTRAPRRGPHRADFARWGGHWSALAAAAALVTMLGAAAWFGLSTRPAPSGGESIVELARAASELQLAEQHYLNAIAALEKLTVQKDTVLDPTVAAEIAASLASIDRAIDDSRAALKTDPGSFVAQTSLLEALRMKVALLQETVSLMNARS
jgi:anti-sigma factor RsiW